MRDKRLRDDLIFSSVHILSIIQCKRILNMTCSFLLAGKTYNCNSQSQLEAVEVWARYMMGFLFS